MAGPTGEMPFLDHLEELRGRLLKVLGAVLVGVGIGVWLVQRLHLIQVLKRPIEPFVPDGKLTVLSPTEPILIILKLAIAVGLVLASPIIIYQIWAFLSPALYDRERRVIIPSLFVGMVLFIAGAVGGFLFVVPPTLNILLNIEPEALQALITFDYYFSFVIHLALAMGLAFELPLILILLTAVGVVTPAWLAQYRRYAIIVALIAAAFLTPGADVTSMLIVSCALILLYEVGMLGSRIVYRRRQRRQARADAASGTGPGPGPAGMAGLLLFLLAATLAQPSPASAQVPKLARPPARGAVVDTTRDSIRARAGPQALDTAAARRVGLPTGPTRRFRTADSIMARLLQRSGYRVTRYQSDSATLTAETRRLELHGQALTERGTTTLEANHIVYHDPACLLDATGDPRLFDGSQVLVGDTVSYNTCLRRGVVRGALTNFQQLSAVWFLRGDVAQDSSSSRIYSSSSEVTSCDLPTPHYHFAAKRVKWINENVLVARPAVLYIADVPILWLPFIFQDLRPGRRSGILIPQFGINDIVRPSPSYNRQVTNVGYYWAPNDYMDVTGRLDWYANRYVNVSLQGRYRWLNRFMTGTIGVARTWEESGSTSSSVRWSHLQDFNLSTRLNLDLRYESNTRVLNNNAIDPILNTQQISSSANFTKRLRWGNIALGGSRRQNVSDGSVVLQFPSLTISPKPIDVTRAITWSPSLSITNTQNSKFPAGTAFVTAGPGAIDTLDLLRSDRTTTVSVQTPIRLGSFNWQNSLQLTDQQTDLRTETSYKVPDPTSGNPADSVTIRRVSTGTFSTGLDWQTGVNLPLVFRGTWKLQPSISIVNTTSGPFLLRNDRTAGQWVRQSKRLEFRIGSNPTLFGFLPFGVGPLARIRHSISPILSYSVAPSAAIPGDYAAAVTPRGQPLPVRSDPQQRLSIGLSQTLEGKLRPPPGDTGGTGEGRKLRLLSWQTSAITYDFEQAKRAGRTGWVTPSITNTFQSDLLSNFSLSLTHDLWEGAVGSDTARFSPFLTSVSASFGLTGRTVRSVLGLFGVGGGSGVESDSTPAPAPPPPTGLGSLGVGRSPYQSATLMGGGSGFQASINYTLSRTRPIPGLPEQPSRQNVSLSTSFSPTSFWRLSWNTQYNVTDSRFESQVVRLERDLHKWRAQFDFQRNANGNFAFYFSIYLTSLPDLKFDYDQLTISQ